MPSLLDLPIELVALTTKDLSKQDILSLHLTCHDLSSKTWTTFATYLETISLRVHLTTNFQTLLHQSPSFALAIQELEIKYPYRPSVNDNNYNWLPLLALLPNLSRLEITNLHLGPKYSAVFSSATKFLRSEIDQLTLTDCSTEDPSALQTIRNAFAPGRFLTIGHLTGERMMTSWDVVLRDGGMRFERGRTTWA